MNSFSLIIVVLGCSGSFLLGLAVARASLSARLRSLLERLRDAEDEDELEEAEYQLVRFAREEV